MEKKLENNNSEKIRKFLEDNYDDEWIMEPVDRSISFDKCEQLLATQSIEYKNKKYEDRVNALKYIFSNTKYVNCSEFVIELRKLCLQLPKKFNLYFRVGTKFKSEHASV